MNLLKNIKKQISNNITDLFILIYILVEVF